MLSFFAFQSISVAVASCMHMCDHSFVSQFLSSSHLSNSQLAAMSSKEPFDFTSMFGALFMELTIKKKGRGKDAVSVQRKIKSADAGSQMFFEDVVQRCRRGDQPSATKQRDDRWHLCEVMKCMIELDELCKEIAEWEGWNAEEYKEMITDYPEDYKRKTNRAFVCFGNSRKRVQRDLGNRWYMHLYYYIHLKRPEFVEQLSELKESLQVNRGPAVTKAELNNKGDVIEYGLYRVRFTGPKIPQRLRDRNIEMMQKFRDFSDLMHKLEMRLARSPILTQSSADEWCNSQRPPPEAFALAIYLCNIAYVDQNDVNLCEAYRAVQALCTTSTPLEATDPWATMLSAFRQRLGWQKYRDPKSGRIWWYHPIKELCRTSNADSSHLR